MPQGFISIGSNIQREHNVVSSLKAISQHFGTLTTSSIYESEAVGFEGDAFYNLVVGFHSALDAVDVAKILRQIELDHGRTRECRKFSARTLDLDLILYGDLIINETGLQIPRLEIEKYAFVLEPLAEIAPDLTHPLLHISYACMWQRFDKTNTRQKRINLDLTEII